MVSNEFKVAADGWFSTAGPEDDVVVSSRINLSRNIEGLVFPEKMDTSDCNVLTGKILEAVKDLKDFHFYNLNNLKVIERQLLAERNYIKLGASFGGEQSILLKENEEVVVIFNHHDHIKIKSIKSGLSLRKAYNCCNELDNIFDKKFNFAFSPKFGYLTSDTTLTGTGMNASVMLFLPAIRRAGKIDKTLSEIIRAGLAVRGFAGESSEKEDSLGDIYIIDNQFAIGKSEEEFIIQLERIANIIIGYERETRNVLFDNDRINIEDEIFRAKGILENCRKISVTEAVRHLSSIKLGKYYNLLNLDITYAGLNCLLLQIQRSHIQNRNSDLEEDVVRAEFLKTNLFSKE